MPDCMLVFEEDGALYWSEQNHSDYDYVKNQRSSLSRYLGEALGGELQIHKNGAFFILNEEHRGLVHPRDTVISDAALLLCAQLRNQITSGAYPRSGDDTVFLTRREFQYELVQCRTQYGNGWGRRLRELPLEKLGQELTKNPPATFIWNLKKPIRLPMPHAFGSG